MENPPLSQEARFAILDQIFEEFLETPKMQWLRQSIETERLLKARERAILDVMYREELGKLIHDSTRVTTDVFLTVNPPPETQFEVFRNAVEEMVGILPGVYLYAYEATGNTERCPHVHILFHHELSGSNWGNLLKKIQNRFAKIVNVKNSRFFNLKHVEANEVHLVIKYIMKTQPAKNGEERTKRAETASMREIHCLDDYYSNMEGAAIQGLIEN